MSGYFYPVAHYVDMWKTADGIAEALHAKGLVNEPKAVPWPSDEAAAEAIGMPVQFIQLLYRSVYALSLSPPRQDVADEKRQNL